MFGKGFSWKRTLGLSSAKGKLSRAIGIPLTESGRKKKAKRLLGPLASPAKGKKKSQNRRVEIVVLAK